MINLEQIQTSFDFLAISSVQERLEAMRDMPTGIDWMRDRWYILVSVAVVIVLMISLIVIHLKFKKRQKKLSQDLFGSNSNRYGLDNNMRELAWELAKLSGASNAGQIFLSSDVFDLGSARLMNQLFKSGMALEKRKAKNAKIKELRDIIGYTKTTAKANVRSNRSRKITSRHVSTGRTVSLVNAKDHQIRLDAEIVNNNDLELWLKPLTSIKVEPGQIWQMYYNLGASVWEFSCYLIGVSEGNLIFGHSDHVKFINRRRFKRVSVNKECWIAKFNCNENIADQKKKVTPHFELARVTELSGPGLRIRSEMEVKIHDRILISSELLPGIIIQDIAEVRHVRGMDDGKMIAVELIGIDEDTVDKLVRETNRLAERQVFNEREIMQMASV